MHHPTIPPSHHHPSYHHTLTPLYPHTITLSQQSWRGESRGGSGQVCGALVQRKGTEHGLWSTTEYLQCGETHTLTLTPHPSLLTLYPHPSLLTLHPYSSSSILTLHPHPSPSPQLMHTHPTLLSIFSTLPVPSPPHTSTLPIPPHSTRLHTPHSTHSTLHTSPPSSHLHTPHIFTLHTPRPHRVAQST